MLISQSLSTRKSELSNLPKFITHPDPNIYVNPDSRYVVLDFETYGENYGDAGTPGTGLVLACWLESWSVSNTRDIHREHSTNNLPIRVCYGSEFEQESLCAAIRSADFIVAHNAKYELKWLGRIGLDLRNILSYCTQIGEYVLAGNERRPLNLGAVAKSYGEKGKRRLGAALVQAGVDAREIPEGTLIDYCKGDVEQTYRIFLKQRRLLKERNQLKTAYARNIVTPVLADIEFNGAALDPTKVQAEYEAVLRSYNDAARDMDRLTGGINFRSPKQLCEFVYGKLGFAELQDRRGNPLRTDTGRPKADKGTIEALKANSPDQRAFQRALKVLAPLKKRVQILEKMVQCCKDDNGVVYATFNQTVTGTHRLSSTGGKYGFQFHNFPRAFKPLFRAKNPGWAVCEADAPQLEFRVAADMGHDRVAFRDIVDGADIHALTAEVMELDRQNAKAFTFKPLYGGNSGTSKAQAYFKAFRERYSGIYDTQTGWVAETLKTKQLRIPSGLIFRWPDTEMQRSGYITNTPSIFNYPVQSFATADIIPLTLVLVWHRLKGWATTLVNTIHDSIIAEVPENELEAYKQVLIDSFTKDIYWLLDSLYGYKMTVPLGVGIKTGEHWGTGTEEKYNAEVG